MNSKVLSLFLLTAIFALSLVSAADFSFAPNNKIITQTLPADITAPITVGTLVINYSDGTSITLQPTINSANTTVTLDTTSLDYTKFYLGKTYTGTFVVSDADTNKTYTVEIKPTYCDNGCTVDKYLEISEIDLTNKGRGEEDNEWYPFDEIEVEVTVENIWDDGDSDTDDDISNIVVEWCLYDTEKGKCTDIEDEENDFKLKEGDDKVITFNIKVNPEDINEDSNDYTLYVKAYSTDNDFDKETGSCVEESESIQIMRDNFMLLSNIVMPTTIPCDGTLDISGEVWNIGEDQEDEVTMRIYNKELGISEIIELGDIDALESSDFSSKYVLPKNLNEKLYTLEIRIFNEDGDLYEDDNDKESVFVYQVKVEGNCKLETAKVEMANPELDESTPSAIAGESLIVKTTLKNTGTSNAVYTISVEGYEEFAVLESLNPSKIVTLAPGIEQEITIELLLKDAVEGYKEFSIKASNDNQSVEKTVGVSIEQTNVKLPAVIEHIKTNWFIYTIILVNLILIIAIISVIKRMVGNKASSMI